LEGIEKSVVAEAGIIGATVTKTYLTPQQFTNFNVVIIDEASMVEVAPESGTRGIVGSGPFRC
jgi:hypothetical protein